MRGGALLSRAVLTVSGASDAELTRAYRRHGDLGAAAFDLFAASPTHRDGAAMNGAGILLGDVEEAFAGMAGAKTTAIRAALVESLLRRATPLEAKYLLKLMLGDMRIGVKQSLVEEAIAVAASNPTSAKGTEMGHPVSVAAVRHAVMLEADLGAAAVRAFAGTLEEARMRLFSSAGVYAGEPGGDARKRRLRASRQSRKAQGRAKREEGSESRRWCWLKMRRKRGLRRMWRLRARLLTITAMRRRSWGTLGCRRFWRTSTTGCGRRCIAGRRMRRAGGDLLAQSGGYYRELSGTGGGVRGGAAGYRWAADF